MELTAAQEVAYLQNLIVYSGNAIKFHGVAADKCTYTHV